jgi:toxin ParE1/3/4
VKTSRLVLSELAVSDILEQSAWYEASENRQLADRWENSLTELLTRLTQTPQLGAPCKFKAAELKATRRIPVRGFPKFLVFYQLKKNEVFVLRVIHGARDLESLFSA